MASSPESKPPNAADTERQRRIMEFYPLVCAIARRLANHFPKADEAEFVSVGVLGLIEALERFDPSRGVPFRAYAEIRIRGAIMDSVRLESWKPRGARRAEINIERAMERFRTLEGRDPSRDELARLLGIPPNTLDRVQRDSNLHRLVSLHSPAGENTTLADQIRSPEPDAEMRGVELATRQEVSEALRFLPERERAAVTLYFHLGLSLKEIGQVLGVTESRASQLRSQGLQRLKSALKRSD
jgi:RNA polymerase sigma factor for flagellar operon FliA